MDKLLNDSALNGDKLFIFSVRRLPGYVISVVEFLFFHEI